jgi:hypothetical protein
MKTNICRKIAPPIQLNPRQWMNFRNRGSTFNLKSIKDTKKFVYLKVYETQHKIQHNNYFCRFKIATIFSSSRVLNKHACMWVTWGYIRGCEHSNEKKTNKQTNIRIIIRTKWYICRKQRVQLYAMHACPNRDVFVYSFSLFPYSSTNVCYC